MYILHLVQYKDADIAIPRERYFYIDSGYTGAGNSRDSHYHPR